VLRPESTLSVVIARSATQLLRREATQQSRQAAFDHSRSAGGILIGKRVGADRIAIVAATDPGPHPDNSNLGFALDTAHANATLEEWFGRDDEVDLIGVWHVHTRGQAQPTDADLDAAQRLLDEAGRTEIINLIVVAGDGMPRINCYCLRHEDIVAGRGLTLVPHEELADQALTQLEPAPPIEQAAVNIPVVATAPAAPTVPTSTGATHVARRPPPLVFVMAILLLLFLIGAGAYAYATSRPGFTPGAINATQSVPTQAVQSAQLVTTTADAEASPTELARTEVPLATEASPAEPAIGATVAPIATQSVVTPEESALTSTAISVSPTEPPTASPTADTNQPLSFYIDPIDDTSRQDFVKRAQALGCEICYNLLIVGPMPYQEVRIRIAGVDRPPLRNFDVPSLAFLSPRAEPYTLQVFDLHGRPLTDPIQAAIAEGMYYTLTVVRVER
jgi:hypothetical protein